MKIFNKSAKIFAALCTAASVLLFGVIISAYYDTSSNYNVTENSNLVINCNIPVSVKKIGSPKVNIGESYNVELKLMGFIPLRRATVNVIEEGTVCVLGKPFGMKVYTEGVLVVNISQVDTQQGNISPATECGLLVGDSILTINGQKVYTNEDVAEIIEKSGGEPLKIIIKREGAVKELSLKPQISKSTGTYKAGIWVRDSSAGIGTLTFYYPKTNVVCGLGHSINDNDTGQILKISSGEIVASEIISVTMAKAGKPGELHGRLLGEKYGKIINNCEIGVFCNGEKEFQGTNMQVAQKQEIVNGQAYIYTCINGTQTQQFTCEIKVNAKGGSDLTVIITDEELINKTGGIVQGMSGSPIVQNGKLVGAVTHVLIDDPTRGYGIFAENMLETARSAEQLKEVG